MNQVPRAAPIPHGYEVVADFSAPAPPTAQICQYPTGCKNTAGPTIHPGQPLFPVGGSNTNKLYILCEHCKAYVDQKPGTKLRQITSSSRQVTSPAQNRGPLLHAVDPVVIRAASSASQRGDLLKPQVLAVPGIYSPAPVSSSRFIQGPSTYVPGSEPSLQRGYLPVHAHYAPMNARTRQLRLASDPRALEVCVISYSVEAQFGKQSRPIFRIPLDGISNVDAHLTGPQLKELVMAHAAENWAKATVNYPFEDEIFTLRLAKTNVDLVRDFPESEAIYRLCLANTVKGTGRFKHHQKVTVVLVLDSTMYEVVDEHITTQKALINQEPQITASATPVTPQRADQNNSSADDGLLDSIAHAYAHTELPMSVITSTTPNQALSVSIATPRRNPEPLPVHSARLEPITPKSKGKKRALPMSPTSPPNSPPHKRTQPTFSLSAASRVIQSSSRVDDALRKHAQQINISQSNETDFIEIVPGSKSDMIQFYAIPNVLYEDLYNAPPILELVDDVTAVNNGTVAYNIRNLLGTGRFKHCFKGQISLCAPLWPSSNKTTMTVALKRPFQADANRPGTTTRYHVPEELRLLLTEAVTWQWADALLTGVYSFIEEQKTSALADNEAPAIPCMRFVNVGVAKSIHPGKKASEALHGTFLVEELIPSSSTFVRLLGNASAIPCVFPAGHVCKNPAQFCAFAQHVQWIITKGRAFCSDWQGGVDANTGKIILTDPQMITNPDLGILFAGGNVPETYLDFPQQHQCEGNIYCEYFKPGDIILPDDIVVE